MRSIDTLKELLNYDKNAINSFSDEEINLCINEFGIDGLRQMGITFNSQNTNKQTIKFNKPKNEISEENLKIGKTKAIISLCFGIFGILLGIIGYWLGAYNYILGFICAILCLLLGIIGIVFITRARHIGYNKGIKIPCYILSILTLISIIFTLFTSLFNFSYIKNAKKTSNNLASNGITVIDEQGHKILDGKYSDT